MSVLRNALCLATLSVALIAAGSARADMVYLSLGNSIAYGLDPSDPATLMPSYADQGFVRPFADALAAYNGGVRPTVVNLAIPGEESTSFLDPANLYPTPPRVWQLNRNYADGTTSQFSLMLAKVAALHAAGDRIGVVSLIFGANDVFGLISSPGFVGGTQAQQQAMLGQTLGTALANYAVVLAELKRVAPEARVLLPGYYNPFPADLLPENHAFYDGILDVFNPALRSIAGQFGATYVDFATPFVGRELAFTNILANDVHPNRAGYAAMGAAMISAVPEPSSVVLLGLGLAGSALLARRRLAA